MIQLDVIRPAANERMGVEIFYAADAQGGHVGRFVRRFCELRKLSRADTDRPTTRAHHSRASQLSRRRGGSFGRRGRGYVTIVTVALDRLTTGFTNRVL